MEHTTHIFHTLIYMIGEMAPYILLGFVIAGVLYSFVSNEMMSRHLSGKGIGTVVKAALIGIPLPLCSCGVLPTAISLKRSGASKAATTSFLVATPQTGVDSIAATWSLLGPAFAIIRPVAAFFTALVAGVSVGKVEKNESILSQASGNISCNLSRKNNRFLMALKYGFCDLIDSIGTWLVVGLIIATLITVFVPADFFASLAQYPFLAMLAVVIIAIPMYVCATGSIPIALSLMMKGLSPGTALVLLLAGPAANFASFAIISKELGRKTAFIYILAIVVMSIALGMLIDKMLPADWFIPFTHAGTHSHATSLDAIQIICSIILMFLLAWSFIRRFFINSIKSKNMGKTDLISTTYKITGMNCPHCQASVTSALAGINGVAEVDVNLKSGIARVFGSHNPDDAIREVSSKGFGIVPLQTL